MHVGDRDLSGQLYTKVAGWVGTRVSLDGYGKSRPHWDSIPGPSSPQRVIIPAKSNFSSYIKSIGSNFNSSIESTFSYSLVVVVVVAVVEEEEARSEAFLLAKCRKGKMFSFLKLVNSGHNSFSFLSYCRILKLQIFRLEPQTKNKIRLASACGPAHKIEFCSIQNPKYMANFYCLCSHYYYYYFFCTSVVQYMLFCLKFVGYKLKVSHLCICYCWLTKNILHTTAGTYTNVNLRTYFVQPQQFIR